MPTADEHRDIARQFYAGTLDEFTERVSELKVDDAVLYDTVDGEIRGRDETTAHYCELNEAFPRTRKPTAEVEA